MKFKEFEAIVKKKYPRAELTPHGKYLGAKINVSINFNPPYGKTYVYFGSYCYVLNKLNIKAVYNHDVITTENLLASYKKNHGTEGFFGEILDYTHEINQYTKLLTDYKNQYIIIKG